MVERKWLTIEQAIEISHMGERTIREKIKLGLLPSYKPGKRRLIDARDLDLFIRKHKAS